MDIITLDIINVHIITPDIITPGINNVHVITVDTFIIVDIISATGHNERGIITTGNIKREERRRNAERADNGQSNLTLFLKEYEMTRWK